MTEPKADADAVPEETPAPGTGESSAAGAEVVGEELKKLSAELDERTNDLKRVTAEYANYRKRVDRDRKLVADQATISVITGLLPVLDDLDRARSHGDLTGPFASVAEQLTGALSRHGLVAFGEKGDAFDPNRHEAVAHMLSPEVTEPTCIDVMRRGYELGDRLVRAALVAVADPDPAAAAAEEEAAASASASVEAEAKSDEAAEPAASPEAEPEVKAEAETPEAEPEAKEEAPKAEPSASEPKPEKRKPSPHPKPKPPKDAAEGESETGSGEAK